MAAETEEEGEVRSVVIRGNGRRRRRSSLRVEIADAENTLFVVFPIRFAADSLRPSEEGTRTPLPPIST